MGITWLRTHKLFPAATNKLEQVDTILDIGCGIMPQNFIKPGLHICCEPFYQYIEHLRNKIRNQKDRQWVLLNSDWSQAVKIFPEKSVDTVFLMDVIEHLEKEEARRLLESTELIARKQIAIFTPLGFMPKEHPDGKDAWGLDGGKWQDHKSGWEPQDFDEAWDIYAASIFHTADHTGKRFKKPYGAFWAIKTHA